MYCIDFGGTSVPSIISPPSAYNENKSKELIFFLRQKIKLYINTNMYIIICTIYLGIMLITVTLLVISKSITYYAILVIYLMITAYILL